MFNLWLKLLLSSLFLKPRGHCVCHWYNRLCYWGLDQILFSLVSIQRPSCSFLVLFEIEVRSYGFHSFWYNIWRFCLSSLATMVVLLCFINSGRETGQMRFELILRGMRDHSKVGFACFTGGQGWRPLKISGITRTKHSKFVCQTGPTGSLPMWIEIWVIIE